MRILNEKLKRREINKQKLIESGFIKKDNIYEYQEELHNYKMQIQVLFDGVNLTSKVIDINTQEEYLLVDVESAYGSFVGKVKDEYNSKLDLIIDSVTDNDVFKNSQAKDVQTYIKEKYDTTLEFPWNDENSIARHKDNKKWFLALLYCKNTYFNIDNEESMEIINLKNDEVSRIVDNTKIYPGYHMNKKHWITIRLDYSLDNESLFKLIDKSFALTK